MREPFITATTYRVSPEGTVKALPGTGSITYNYRVGDSAVDMAGDHVEPSVSITHDGDDERALNILAQVGNRCPYHFRRSTGINRNRYRQARRY